MQARSPAASGEAGAEEGGGRRRRRECSRRLQRTGRPRRRVRGRSGSVRFVQACTESLNVGLGTILPDPYRGAGIFGKMGPLIPLAVALLKR